MRPILSLTVAGMLALGLSARAGTWDTGSLNIPIAIQSATNGTLTSTSGTAFTVHPGVALSLDMSTVAGAVAGAGVLSNAVAGIDTSSDGTHFTTTTPITLTNSLNGTTPVEGHVTLTAAQMANIQAIRVDSFGTTATTNVTCTAIYYSQYY